MNGRERGAVHRRLSRETRHLLLAAVVAVAVLWVLARLRFPDRPATPNPIPPLLTQLANRPAFADLDAEIARTRTRLAPSLLVWLSPAPSKGAAEVPRVALRLRPDTAVVFLPPNSASHEAADLLALDRATGLAVVRTLPAGPVAPPAPWSADTLDAPRHLLVTAPIGEAVSLRPLFFPALRPRRTAAWSSRIWAVPEVDAPDGALVFTPAGDLVGALTTYGRDRAIVPADTLLNDAARLAERGLTPPGTLGIQAQPLTPRLSAATGASSGVVVAAVDPEGAAAPYVQVGDVVTALNGVELETPEYWEVPIRRLAAGDPAVLHVRRDGVPMRIELMAAPAADRSTAERSLGLQLRGVPGLGSEVLSVTARSAAAEAGLRVGDVITRFGDVDAPGPAQVRRVFAAAATAPVLVAVSRQGAPVILVVER